MKSFALLGSLLSLVPSCKDREITPPPSGAGKKQSATHQTQAPIGNETALPEQQGQGQGQGNLEYREDFYYQNPDNNNKGQQESKEVQAPVVDCKSTKQVYAFYYAWFAPPAHGGWKGIEVSHGDAPSYGLYDSADEAKIVHDIKIAKSIGINGFAIAWIGDHPNDGGKNKPNKVLQTMLRKAREMGFCIAALFEAEMIHKDYGMNVATQMNYLANILNAYPENTFRVSNKPVVFIWKNELVPAATWKSINSNGKVYLVGDGGPATEGVTAAKNGETANAYYYSTWWSASLTAMGNMWNNLGSKPKFGTASPGFRPPHASCPGHAECYGRWKNTGDQVYKQQWNYLLTKRPDYAIITSYNEWPEGHYIEKGQKYGDHYLNLSKQFISQFRQ